MRKPAVFAFAAIGAFTLCVWLSLPTFMRRMVSTKVLPAVEKRLDRKVTYKSLEASLGSVVLRGVTIRGDRDCAGPLLRADWIEIKFSPWSVLSSQVKVTSIKVFAPVVSACWGPDNFRDILARRGKRRRKGRVKLPSSVLVKDGAVLLKDRANDIEAEWKIDGRLFWGKPIRVNAVRVKHGHRNFTASTAVIDGREVSFRNAFANDFGLSWMYGSVVVAGRHKLRVNGCGSLDRKKVQGRACLDGQLALGRDEIRYKGRLLAKHASVFSRKLAHQEGAALPVTFKDIDAAVSFFWKRRGFISISGTATIGGKVPISGSIEVGKRARVDVTMGEAGCNDVFQAIPFALRRQMQGAAFGGKMKGQFYLDYDPVKARKNRRSIKVGMSLDYKGCSVKKMPRRLSASRLKEPFGYSFMDSGNRIDISLKKSFVRLNDVSSDFRSAVLCSEDFLFPFHDGFVRREFKDSFRVALSKKRFVAGASSITMQMVKNVLLSRRRTVARKLQEVILTWYLEKELSKSRIFEIYVNVVEFGPGIYGIKAAAEHYFAKKPRDLSLLESVYLASLLPSPKRRYKQFCYGSVSKYWRKRMNRLLKVMLLRKKFTEAEFNVTLGQPLLFSKKHRRTIKSCLDRLAKFRRK